MFGMSAERNGVERPPRIDSGGTPPHPDEEEEKWKDKKE